MCQTQMFSIVRDLLVLYPFAACKFFMIDVEDREPVTNSMKFKQMLLKSKEKKESKKLQKQEKKAEHALAVLFGEEGQKSLLLLLRRTHGREQYGL